DEIPIDNDNVPLLSFTDSPVNGSEILEAISELLTKKSEDFNGVSMFFIKQFKHYLFNPLQHIINRSLVTGFVPHQFKIAKVIPLFKSGDKSSPDNYRPISLLSCFSKILEKVVGRRLVSFLELNNIITPSQFGFRKNHSTLHPMVHLMNFVSDALNKKESAIAIFCDLRKAFDTVNHSILLRKLHKIGIRGVALEWFKNYLSGRKQFVFLNGKCSTLLEILLGVPQGSILGPILFLLYINDLPEASLLKDFLFADDTALLAKGKNVEELTTFVNTEFQKIVHYFRLNKLSLHPDKTKFLIFSNSHLVRENPPQIFANYHNLSGVQKPELIIPIENANANSIVPAIRYLGVYFDPQLNFKYHISTITNKLSKMLYFFRQAKHVLTPKAKTSLYYASIHSHLIYGIHIWSCTAESNLKQLILKQKMAIRTLCNSAYNAHTEPLFKKCAILPFLDLCEYFKVQFMQKFTQGFLPASFNEVWVTNAIRRADQDHVELRNDDDINIPFARLTSTERQPLTSFPRIWSQFPDEQIKFTRNVPEFNKLLKQHYLRKLSSIPRCTRLFCPQCMPPLNALYDDSNDSN
ncbi:MAG: RNA-directed DNA polymerase, partial [bacterium]